MCGIAGIVSHQPVNQELYDALTVLQHRGQDAAGIMTDADHLLHANAWHMAVAVEPLESAITRIANYYAEPIGARRIDISSKRGRTPDWLSVSA